MLFAILLGIVGGLGGLAILFFKSAFLGVCMTLFFVALGVEIGGVIDAAIADYKIRHMRKKAQ